MLIEELRVVGKDRYAIHYVNHVEVSKDVYDFFSGNGIISQEEAERKFAASKAKRDEEFMLHIRQPALREDELPDDRLMTAIMQNSN